MTEHGIMTTKADYWVHLFPLMRRVFWYRVALMREYLRITGLVEHIGHSKDGSPTGSGYLVPQSATPVRASEVPIDYFAGFVWVGATDREIGFRGEFIVGVLLEHGVVKLPLQRATRLDDSSSQFASTDYQTSFMTPALIEVKTELKESTKNLFVQTRERGHKVHQIRTDGGVTERFSEAPEFRRD
jgi:hypothetical protein